MIALRGTYTVKPEYVTTNQKNIAALMDHLHDHPIEGLWHKAFLLEDGQSFMHLNIAKDQATLDKISEVDAYRNFRTQLGASGPVAAPKLKNLSPVGELKHFF